MKLRLFYSDGGIHPVLGQVYCRRKQILDGDDEARYQRYIANTLSGIAQSVEDCERILSVVEAIMTGQEVESEVEGNDVDITLSGSGVQIDISINDDWVGKPEGLFLLSEFKVAMSAWKKFLMLPESLESEVTVEL